MNIEVKKFKREFIWVAFFPEKKNDSKKPVTLTFHETLLVLRSPMATSATAKNLPAQFHPCLMDVFRCQ